MRLTATTDRESVAAHVRGSGAREALRTADERANRLQRNARIRTGRWDLELAIEPERTPASIEAGDEGPRIVLSGDRVPQPVTDYEPRQWDLLVQTALVMHEVGHLRHSDFADLADRLEGVKPGWRGVFGRIWTVFEDAAIEAAIRDRWPNYGRWLAQVRANLLVAAGPGIEDPRGGTVYPMVDAIALGVLDRLAYDSGRFARLLDPQDETHRFHVDRDRQRFLESVKPALEETTGAVATSPDPRTRNELALGFATEVRPHVEAAVADGRAQAEADRRDAWGMPAEWDSGLVTDLSPIEVLETGGAPADAEHELSDRHQTSRTTERPEVPSRTETPSTDPAIESVLAEAVADEERSVSADRDARVANLEALQAAVAAADADLETDGVVLPTDEPAPDESTAAVAREDGERLARLLRNRFQTRRRRHLRRNLRRGRLDPAALHRHALGEKQLKLRRETPEETDHHCLLVLDRSGSMRPHIRIAERAMGMLVVALEAVDVEVSVIELLDKQVRLAKSPDVAVGEARHRLYHGEATGGTPLTDTLHIARERLKRESGTRFLFVITDGLPADPDRYREALDRFSVPVVGVNLNTDRAAGTRAFHRQVTVEPETGELRVALRGLVQEVLFE